MSKTIRKTGRTYFNWYNSQINSGYSWYGCRKLTDEEIESLKVDLKREMWRNGTDNQWTSYNKPPQHFRNWTNRLRRIKDRREIWKAVNWEEYPEQCSDWGCKDNRHWDWY